MNIIVRENCPICQSRDINIIYREDFLIKECQECSFCFCSDYIERDYSDDSYLDPKQQWKSLSEKDKFVKEFRKYALIVKKHVKQQENWLDVGANLGFAILAAESTGFEAHGIDPAPNIVKLAKREYGINILQGFLKDMVNRKTKYQVISYFDVIEHIGDIQAELNLCRLFLKKEGFLIVKVPNCYKEIESLKIGKKVNLWAPDHKNYFTWHTLKLMLGKNGFKIIRIICGIYFYDAIKRVNPLPNNKWAVRFFKYPLYPLIKAIQFFYTYEIKKSDYLICIAQKEENS